jgi:iron(III) transport system ATP-binding protein
MGSVQLQGLTKTFAGSPPTTAMNELNLEIEEGEFVVLLGPSGCGKTTTLRSVAGLERPDQGRIVLGETTVFDSSTRTDLAPNKRNIGMVFQSYALWPHMTVRKNIAYPLKARRIRTAGSEKWLAETADLVEVGGLLDRYPGQLSGGQQQRVALARGLVARPDVVLFDEPLSNLDARLRDSVRAQLHELYSRLGFTGIFVTHDQNEALALGSRLAIMRDGRFEQIDTPQRVFERPASEYVAEFIGLANRLTLVRQADHWALEGQRVVGELPVPRNLESIVVRARPEDVVIARQFGAASNREIRFDAEVVDAQFGGRHMDVTISVNGRRVLARTPAGDDGGWGRSLVVGQKVSARIAIEFASMYAPDGHWIAADAAVETGAPLS